MKIYRLGETKREKPHLFKFMGKWSCTVYDSWFGVGDTPQQAYDNYCQKTRWGQREDRIL